MRFLPASDDTWRPCSDAHIAAGLLLSPSQWKELAACWPQDLPVGLWLANDVDVQALEGSGMPLAQFATLALHFPKWTDGRAYSQAVLLRRRLGWTGEIRAEGDVVVDMALQLWRCGFDEARLRPGQDPAIARKALRAFDGLAPGSFYQGDARKPLPRFLRNQAA